MRLPITPEWTARHERCGHISISLTLRSLLKPWTDLQPTTRARIGQVAGAVVSVLFLVLAVRLLHDELSGDVFARIPAAMASLKWWQIGSAVVLSIVVHVWLGLFDKLGLMTLGIDHVPTKTAARTGFIAYSFVHNIGLSALTGNVIRIKRYAAWGVKPTSVAKLFVCLIFTMWIGWTVAFGASIVAWPTGLLPMTVGVERALGAVMLAVVAVYILVCFAGPARLRSADAALKLPDGRHAVAQAFMGTVNWMATALVLWLVLPASAAYCDVLAALCIAQVVVIASHVPGGVGVLEGTLLVLLGDRVDPAGLAAGVVLFRAIYFLLPFVISLLVLLGEQIHNRLRSDRGAAIEHDRRSEARPSVALSPTPT